MRILHTADWHLGHTLRDHSRQAEHEQFLRWLVQTIVARQVDALLIAGDVFDSANPPPAAWRMWFEFLGELKQQRPTLQVVVIAGNHDSAARLEAPRELLAAFDVRVVGSLRRDAAGDVLVDELIFPLRNREGEVAALCVAMPFLRGSDVLALTRSDGEVPATGDEAAGDPWIEAMRQLHAAAFAAAQRQRGTGQALVAMGHGYFVGGQLSELSERKVFGGNQHALPLDLFPAACTYVALGHLHRPQLLGGHEHVRYSGSPIPLAMPEREYPHHVVFADLRAGELQKVWSLRVPRSVELLRLPERGWLEPEAAMAAVQALPERDPAMRDDQRPLLEVAVRLPVPAPGLGEDIARCVQQKNVRLVRVEIELTGGANGDVDAPTAQADLSTLTPEQIFERRFRRDHDGELPDDLRAAFRTLLDEVQNAAAARG